MQELSVTTSTSNRFMLTAVCILVCGARLSTSEPSGDIIQLPGSSERNNQLSFSRPDSFQSISNDEGLRGLSDLLLVKQSMLNLLSKPSPAAADTELETEDQTDASTLTKRVFCNSFSGCGGRFRGRRRQQQPVEKIGKRRLPNLRKRPFCNSYGCFNSGKKRFSPASSKNLGSNMTPLSDALLQDRIKKLFCNGYGGCQNLGKRLGALDAAVAKAAGDEARLSLPLTTRSLLNNLGGMKRMFTSQFDDDIDSLIDSMRR